MGRSCHLIPQLLCIILLNVHKLWKKKTYNSKSESNKRLFTKFTKDLKVLLRWEL